MRDKYNFKDKVNDVLNQYPPGARVLLAKFSSVKSGKEIQLIGQNDYFQNFCLHENARKVIFQTLIFRPQVRLGDLVLKISASPVPVAFSSLAGSFGRMSHLSFPACNFFFFFLSGD